MLSASSSGSFARFEKFLNTNRSNQAYSNLDHFGKIGVSALAKATPTETGKTASSWRYKIIQKRGLYGIEWYNDNVNEGEVIALLIQYGHGTGTGGYIEGIDYINPAIRPIFTSMIDDVWKKVTQ